MTSAHRALVLDFDGVVSPVGGHTAWGDDVLAGHLFGPVYTSPAMTAALDKLAATPGVSCWWLTSWTPEMRARLDPCPGHDWFTIPAPTPTRSARGWWKAQALYVWLEDQPEVRFLAWCDDDLNSPARAAAVRRRLHLMGVRSLLIAPTTTTGLTRRHLDRLSAWAAEPSSDPGPS